APAVRPFGRVLVAAKVPVAPVPHAVGTGADARQAFVLAAHRAAIVPALDLIALFVAPRAVDRLAHERRAGALRRDGLGQRAAAGHAHGIDHADQRPRHAGGRAGRQGVRWREPDDELGCLGCPATGLGGVGLWRPQIVDHTVAPQREALRVFLPHPARGHADRRALAGQLDPASQLAGRRVFAGDIRFIVRLVETR